jgi:pectate lyase
MKISLLVLALAATYGAALAQTAADPARAHAPQDGWAGQQGGTQGGALAAPNRVYAVKTRAELLAALKGDGARIIRVLGEIDMSEGRPFASSADQAQRGQFRLPSHSTLIGAAPGAGFIHANLVLSEVEDVIVRNLRFRNPCDVGPVWDPRDGATGNWNSLFDAISVVGARHVWIDHNSFTDAPVLDTSAPIENGMLKQCHDGALDISRGADLISVTYNHFALHEKNTLVGSSDRAGGDEGKLSVSFSNNLFENVSARAPRVRFGKVHLYNNLHLGSRKHPDYEHEYSVGVGYQAKIISQANAYQIEGAQGCQDVVKNPGNAAMTGQYADQGSELNGQPLTACPFVAAPAWQVPYAFTALAAPRVAGHVLDQAGAGKIAISSAAPGTPPSP